MKRITMTCLAIAACSVVQAADAQTGTRFDRVGEVDASVEGMRFGQCLANYRPGPADAWLATAPGTDADNTARAALIPRHETHCVQFGAITIGGSQLSFSPGILRGHVARGRYLALHADGPPPAIANAAPATIPVEVYNARVTSAADTQAEIVRIFGDCMAAAEPMKVDALVRVDMDSREEAAAIGALQPAMGPCLWNGQTIAFSRESLRAALADALYRKARASLVEETAG